ncbi:ribonuclease III [Coraliomargarita sp. SDUM461003]|uniref:Ribonuclease 3 n=1 Tax=Thalassobacterium maritimum TaxID=3041265 RepID=A0ABU1ATS2_9BACT|nr:ribonuclease III [Coraliomargarita sp. SDUM461003]MDQ8207017.1 ribonuclease III [Coraliomargarita sp. SDUM461003]
MHTPDRLFEPISQHSFQDETLLQLALTHSSCDRASGDNQRLEFLGDAVLDLVVAEVLYNKFPQADEGALDRCRASIVNGKSLARVAQSKGLGKYLEVSDAHRQHQAEPSKAMLEDALEALIGAVYLDAGLAPARQTILHLFGDQIDAIELSAGNQNPKGKLQEWSQKHHAGEVPRYQELPAAGPDHDRHYSAAVFLGGKELGRGTGSSKKAAEAKAAAVALEHLK